ncbi:hypothetical protein [Streptomyces sp. CMB-StM0423]|uniref:hypothetical protein n=1 Tax=Streptomyces sp. CMB-StM0423 TaxID=2059884 RepID=UPI00131ABBA9|nr:hypothetical protein [Streptomyces sp. CMB-StM0423]
MIISRFVEGGGCSGDVTDPAGAERDVLKGAPSLLEFGGGAFAEGSHVPDQGVEHAGAARGADAPSVCCEQAGRVVHDVARDVGRGNRGDQREASGGTDMILW